jgi:glycogen phosphorylase
MSTADITSWDSRVGLEQDSPAAEAPLTHEASAGLTRYGCGPIRFSGSDNTFYERRLIFDKVIEPAAATLRDQFEAFALSLRDVLSQRWVLTTETYARENPKRVYYLSMEYLLGRSLANNVINLTLEGVAAQAVKHKQIDWLGVLEQEPDPGLGNGGLGRLAACFLDSMATLQLPAMGYGLRYEYGVFAQSFRDGWQVEQPDRWLRYPDPWEVARPDERVEVKLGCSVTLRDGNLELTPGPGTVLIGIPYDRPVVGYGGDTINTLRLWSATVPDEFDFQRFSAGDFVAALAESLAAESLTRVLYPDDSTVRGQGLRFVQEYFLVACSLADLVRRFELSNEDWSQFPDKVAIQLNDTHPALAVPELMRLLLDEAHLGWDEAWQITRQTLAYTNHTLLPEALEKWPLELFELLLPRQLEIILEINRRFLDEMRARFPGDEARLARASLIEVAAKKYVRMAHLAIVGSHSTNGVAALHSELLRTTTVRDLAEMFPERFNNKTNGVTPRRWLCLANPALSHVISKAIGRSWITDLDELRRLRPLAAAAEFREEFRRAKRTAKGMFAHWLSATTGISVDPDTLFDCQIKRIHEYKRQLLNVLRIVVLYNRLRANPRLDMVPRTVFFGGKAAPAYRVAKLIIKLINNVADTVNRDPAVGTKLRVLFLPDYDVSLAEGLIAAADVSNQISTAGYEASGTSNMKFMMNGALTLGTLDGATIEMAEEVGKENIFLFGLSAQQVIAARGSYSAQWHYDNDSETRSALDLIFSDHFSRHEPGVFEPLREVLLTNDRYMHLADLHSYLETDGRLMALYRDPEAWAQMAILNVAASGRFSSDRTISEYVTDIWRAEPCPVRSCERSPAASPPGS